MFLQIARNSTSNGPIQGTKNNKFNFSSIFNEYTTVVGDYINKMKTTFDFNFDLYKAFKQHAWYTKTWKQKEPVN